MADRVDRGVDAAALGGGLARPRAGRPRSGARAAAPNERASSRRSATRVDRDHLRRARPPCAAWTAHRPDRAEPEHGDGVARAGCRPGRRRGSPCPSRRRRTGRRRRTCPPARGGASGSRAGRAPARPARPGASRASCRGRRRAPSSHLWKSPRRQKKQLPQAVRSSPARGRPRRPGHPSPAATTVPTNSWPIVKPGSIATRPW